MSQLWGSHFCFRHSVCLKKSKTTSESNAANWRLRSLYILAQQIQYFGRSRNHESLWWYRTYRVLSATTGLLKGPLFSRKSTYLSTTSTFISILFLRQESSRGTTALSFFGVRKSSLFRVSIARIGDNISICSQISPSINTRELHTTIQPLL